MIANTMPDLTVDDNTNGCVKGTRKCRAQKHVHLELEIVIFESGIAALVVSMHAG